MTAAQAAPARAAGTGSAHTAGQIISVITGSVITGRAVAVASAVAADALERPVASPGR